MAVLISPESEEAKERRKFEAQHSQFGPAGRPYVYREYPMMLHKAGRPESGLGAHCIVEHQIVGSREEEDRYTPAGFRRTPNEAIDCYKAQHVEFAKLAAERNYDVKNKLSEKAGAEVVAAEEAYEGHGHMPMVPETPIAPKKRS